MGPWSSPWKGSATGSTREHIFSIGLTQRFGKTYCHHRGRGKAPSLTHPHRYSENWSRSDDASQNCTSYEPPHTPRRDRRVGHHGNTEQLRGRRKRILRQRRQHHTAS